MSGAALWPGRNAPGQNYPGYAPAGGITPTYPTKHAIYFATTSIILKWGLVTNANAYRVEVSPTPDFSGTLTYSISGLTVHQVDFTDGGTDDTKRWWRWAYSYDGGTTYSRWSEVGSYWLNTSGAENVEISPTNTWMMINPDDVTDRYNIQDFPLYGIKQGHLFRVRERNRLGTLLSEFITLKGSIQLVYDESIYLTSQGFFEFRRFNEEAKTFFLATFKNNISNITTPNIWKVQFEEDPEMTMLAAGRQDLYVGTLNFMEV